MFSINSSDRTCIFTFLLLSNGSLTLPFINIIFCINLTQELRFDIQFIHYLINSINSYYVTCLSNFNNWLQIFQKSQSHFLMTLNF